MIFADGGLVLLCLIWKHKNPVSNLDTQKPPRTSGAAGDTANDSI